MFSRANRFLTLLIGVFAVAASLIVGLFLGHKSVHVPDIPKGATLSLFLSYNWSLVPVKPSPTLVGSMNDNCLTTLKSDLRGQKVTRLRFTALKNVMRPLPDSIAEGLISTEGGQNYRFVNLIYGCHCYSIQADLTEEDPKWTQADRFPR